MSRGTIAEAPRSAPVEREPARPDPRVLRTHRSLHDAMVELCLEVGYRSVTIDQLVQRAGVTRATFYTHFRDKEQLLSAIAEQVVSDVLDRFQQEAVAGADRLLMLFEDAEIHPDRLRVVLRGEGDGVALRIFMDRVAEVIEEVDTTALTGGAPPLQVDAGLAVRSMAGQITEVLRWWIESTGDGTPRLARTEVVRQIRIASGDGRLAHADPRRQTITDRSSE